ncbi:BREX-1 system adenine-specific DNA-methyltransferase PglX [Rhodococcus opacus]|uniref:BREX-1 system adenine-specific DNA-methyltransferase PglX n=1 Tax=Rhodococcus opacus TaxID=37919 RepID=UPI001F584AA9|nr:BREX-1 system adenine-specific DNA-methyltransferase PglX [Rhodococcus opacus]UNN05192.1 BREX-1 system adenine-specific DNA-methyltransferase PglX [Rhodococcus opacus]
MKNTAALKTFATSSRTTLIEQMRGRVKQLLDDPKAAAEYPHDVRALRDSVDEHGLAWVADTAAYTWFNRLTAARYMDANGFSGSFGVVSPAAGSSSALPEILTRAQAGEFPHEVPQHVQVSVVDLLTGKRTSTDPDAEAYTLLLSAMFASWHKPMPEVFPAAVDWIRLLTPLDMLAPASVRARAVQVMDAAACGNVEVVGWLYQFYNSDLKDQINNSNVAIDAAKLPAVTQLFTPEYIVRYLVQNSLGRLWLRSRPSSGLREHMEYYIEPVAGQEDTGVTVASPEEIRVLDPACGSGHMLTYAFDLLFRIYEEEGYTPSSIPQMILTHNLRGLEIDERAAQLASFALAMKARDKDRRFFARRNSDDQPVQPDIVRVTPLEFDELETKLITGAVSPEKRDKLARLMFAFNDADTYGSLIRVDPDALDLLNVSIDQYEQPDAEMGITSEVEFRLMGKARTLGRQARALADNQYHVVVANPPYLGSGNMGDALNGFAKKNYPNSYADLCVTFIERSWSLARRSGSVAMVTKHQWMFISSYRKFRPDLFSQGRLSSMAHLGARAFDAISGEVVQACAFVIDVESRSMKSGRFLRLVEGRNEDEKARILRRILNGDSDLAFSASYSDFSMIPDCPIVYWASDHLKAAFQSKPPLSAAVVTREGLTTGNNDEFLRWWHEVPRAGFSRPLQNSPDDKKWEARWYPYQKGGEYRKWHGNVGLVVDWQDDGRRQRMNVDPATGRIRSHNYNGEFAFLPGFTWTNLSGGDVSVRISDSGFMFDTKGPMGYPISTVPCEHVVGLLNSVIGGFFLSALSPTLDLKLGHMLAVPYVGPDVNLCGADAATQLVALSRDDWNSYETSWEFENNPLVAMGCGTLEAQAKSLWDDALTYTTRAQELEVANNRYFAELYELEDEVDCEVPRNRISLTQNPYFRYAQKGATHTEDEYRTLFDLDLAKELTSYAVGCMMGRYSLDKPGLILADAGSTIADFNETVPSARFRPDADGIIPITAEHYFEDDIVARMREFLTVAFGKENVEANVAWLEFALGSGNRKSLRDYFLKDFYNDHVKLYSKRPIYWQVSSNSKTDKGFNALFYLHRYTPATLGIIRENYANQMTDKQQARLETIEHALPTAGKAEATKLSKERDLLTAQRREIREWITNKLFPLSTTEVPLDLDDGVKRNYLKLKDVLRKVTGL